MSMSNQEMLLSAMRSLLDEGEIVGFGSTELDGKLLAETRHGDTTIKLQADNTGVWLGNDQLSSEEAIKSAILQELSL